MTQAILARALATCLGLGALDVGVLNLVVLPRIGQVSAGANAAPAAALRVAPQVRSVPVSSSVPAAAAAALPATPPAEPAPILIVEFAKSWRRLDAQGLARLNEAVTRLRDAPEIVVIGHADADGPEDLNERVSAERAAAVARWLANAGVARVRMHVEARGEREPRREGGNDRRVELYARAAPAPPPGQPDASPFALPSAPAASSQGERSTETGPDSTRTGGQR